MSNYSIFSVMGLEIEYMLVDRDTLAVQPVSDVILNGLNSSCRPREGGDPSQK